MTSLSDMLRYWLNGMGGPIRLPSRIAVMISPSLQAPMPVFMSGVILGTGAVNGFSTTSKPPANSMPSIKRMSGLRVL